MAVDAVTLRAFSTDDQEPVAALVIAGMAEHWGTVDESLNPDLRDIAGAYAHGTTLVAELDGEVVGTGTIVPRREASAEIVRMAVDSGRRRLGIGRLLVEELLAIAATWGASRVVLETSADWTESAAFYLGCGFVVTHQHEGDFGLDTWFERRITNPG